MDSSKVSILIKEVNHFDQRGLLIVDYSSDILTWYPVAAIARITLDNTGIWILINNHDDLFIRHGRFKLSLGMLFDPIIKEFYQDLQSQIKIYEDEF
jgi:hypothetical protein